MRKLFPYPITLDEQANQPAKINDVQVMKVGEFNHAEYGKFKITPQTLAEIKKNFDNKVRRVDIAIDYFHNGYEEAAGWIREMYLSDDGNALFAKVDWTPSALKKLQDREIRYFSPEWCDELVDEETGDKFQNVLIGGGLTNRPFLKEMMPIAASEKKNKKGDSMNLEESKAKIEELTKKLNDMTKQYQDAEKQLGDMGAMDKDKEIEALKAKIAQLEAQLAQAASEKKMSEKKATFTKLLSEGKVCQAQEEAYLKDDMVKFAELAQKVNLNQEGQGGGEGGGEKDPIEKVMKLAREKIAANKKLQTGEAISMVLKENKELAKQYSEATSV